MILLSLRNVCRQLAVSQYLIYGKTHRRGFHLTDGNTIKVTTSDVNYKLAYCYSVSFMREGPRQMPGAHNYPVTEYAQNTSLLSIAPHTYQYHGEISTLRLWHDLLEINPQSPLSRINKTSRWLACYAES